MEPENLSYLLKISRVFHSNADESPHVKLPIVIFDSDSNKDRSKFFRQTKEHHKTIVKSKIKLKAKMATTS